MNVRIKQILAPGDLDHERVTMKASAADDIGKYVLFRTGFNGKVVTTGVTHTLWFPDHAVKSGDLIVLYTKTGQRSVKSYEDGSSSHFFYWGMPHPLWSSGDFSVVLLHVDQWQAMNPQDAPDKKATAARP